MASSTTSLAHLLPPPSSSSNPLDPSSRLLTPTTNPIPLLPNSTTKQYARYIHTPLVMLYFYTRSRSLIDDPLNTMLTDAFVLAVIQSAFVTSCLPYVGVWDSGEAIQGTKGVSGAGPYGGTTGVSSGANTSLGSGSVRKRLGAPVGGGAGGRTGGTRHGEVTVAIPHWRNRVTPLLLSLVMTLVFPPIPITFLALTLGAPLYPLSSIPHTFILSIHVSLLCFLPIFYAHGVSPQSWRDVTAAWLPFDNSGVWGGSTGCFLGGWMGAIPMALDWDRDWQAWPCTVLWGCILGWAVGRTVTCTLGFGVGKRIDLSEKPSVPGSALIGSGTSAGSETGKGKGLVDDATATPKKSSLKKIEAGSADTTTPTKDDTIVASGLDKSSTTPATVRNATTSTSSGKTASSTSKSSGSKGKKSS